MKSALEFNRKLERCYDTQSAFICDESSKLLKRMPSRELHNKRESVGKVNRVKECQSELQEAKRSFEESETLAQRDASE